MTIGRVTQNMMSQQSLAGMQTGLGRLAKIQEQLSTGRIINRPSDDPTGADRGDAAAPVGADQQQYARNADDGMGWLDQSTPRSARWPTPGPPGPRPRAPGRQQRRHRQPAAREALATEVDQIREGLLASANTTYLGRPIFGGITAGATAYDADDGDLRRRRPATVHPHGRRRREGPRRRRRAGGVRRRTATRSSTTSTRWPTALRAGDSAGIRPAIDALDDGPRADHHRPRRRRHPHGAGRARPSRPPPTPS